jgi:hypothetical protein
VYIDGLDKVPLFENSVLHAYPSHIVSLFVSFLFLLFFRQRGDGFPLAAMLAAIAVDNKDLVPVLTAHILYVLVIVPVCCCYFAYRFNLVASWERANERTSLIVPLVYCHTLTVVFFVFQYGLSYGHSQTAHTLTRRYRRRAHGIARHDQGEEWGV